MLDGPSLGRLRRVAIVITGPSGVGKTSSAGWLLSAQAGLRRVVTVTTRSPRPAEVDGTDYDFVDEPTFHRMQAEGRFLDVTDLGGSRYGLEASAVEAVFEARHVPLLVLDPAGTRRLVDQDRTFDVVDVFLAPPDASATAVRMTSRADMTTDERDQRLGRLADDLSFAPLSMHVVVASSVEQTVTDLLRIVRAALRHPPVD